MQLMDIRSTGKVDLLKLSIISAHHGFLDLLINMHGFAMSVMLDTSAI